MLKTGIELYASPPGLLERDTKKSKNKQTYFNPLPLLTGAEQDGSIGSGKSEASMGIGTSLARQSAELLLPVASPGVSHRAAESQTQGYFFKAKQSAFIFKYRFVTCAVTWKMGW